MNEEKVEGMRATPSEWKEFLGSNVYADMMDEIDKRSKLILPRLVSGKDPVWSDDNMRGRLDELAFVASIAEDIVAAYQMEEGASTKTNSYMDRLFEVFKQSKQDTGEG